MENKYKVGTLIAAQNNPHDTLIITRYLKRIYYCEATGDTTHKLLAFFERELTPITLPKA